ncbi:hypothetical protein [Bradyrhizobium sp. NP1]|uniref:hypothetical protein n=1 Tax=Bradyrhizobium sp. NP1 TaxID=3049772 RepID=UPI0025A609D7|nr:hypothetical protein [Bradyrhizobium sp. NP1]WJR76460.1 hypothetical protein QOU61_27405 [Bradyrhizobium sp. NP1]
MIDKIHQIGLMRGAIEDYRNGLMSLQELVSAIDGLLSVIDDNALWNDVFEPLFEIEQVNASSYLPHYDFERYGRSTVELALEKILEKTGSYSAR